MTIRKVSPNILLVVSLYAEDEPFREAFSLQYASSTSSTLLRAFPCGTGEGLRRGPLQHEGGSTGENGGFQLSTTDVLAAVRGQNVQVVAGQLGAPPVPSETAPAVYHQRPGGLGLRQFETSS